MVQISRNPFLGGVLGILFPGLGFMYGGNIRLSVYFNLTFVFLTFILGWFVVKETPIGIYLNFMLIMMWYIFSFFGSFVYVWMNRDITKRSNNQFLYYILFAFCIVTLQYSFTKHRGVLLGYEIHRNTGYVGTTLLRGDFVLIDTKPAELDIGDILVYEGNKRLLMATVLKKQDNGFILNNRNDKLSIIPGPAIHGKVIYIWFSWNSDDRVIHWKRFPRDVQGHQQVPHNGFWDLFSEKSIRH